MFTFFKKIVVVFLLLMIFSCKSAYQTKDKQKNDNPQARESLLRASSQALTIPPKNCRIVGTIVFVDEPRSDLGADDPCSKVPCQAVVRVDSILGYGQGFVKPLGKGKEIEVLFKFTLSPTKDLFPNMEESYPGLKLGSYFLADIEGYAIPQIDSNKQARYLIYGYEVK